VIEYKQLAILQVMLKSDLFDLFFWRTATKYFCSKIYSNMNTSIFAFISIYLFVFVFWSFSKDIFSINGESYFDK